MGWLQQLAAELAITLSDRSVWLSIGQWLLFGGVCLLVGVWVARLVGLLSSDAPAGETLGVGLASGLLVLASWWAAVASSGRSSFTPVAVGFGIAIALTVMRRRSVVDTEAPTTESNVIAEAAPATRSVRRRNLVVATLGGAVFIVAIALLYGSTMAPSPREGAQPVEFFDEAYYSMLGADLAKTGTETIYSPSGFSALEGLPVQTWYHWGELWLESAVITTFGTEPLNARHMIVLPVVLLAAAALTGALVQQMTRSASYCAFLFGFLACLFLAPMPFIPGPWFSSWAVGLLFGITLYGLAAVAVLLGMYGLAVLGSRTATWALACFVGSAAALIVPAHPVIALLTLVGVGSVWTIRISQSLVATRHLPAAVAPIWRRTFLATGISIAVTVGWGLLTGHGVGTSGFSPSVSPFNASWTQSLAITIGGAGALVAVPIAWFYVRKGASIEAGLYHGTAVLVIAGAIIWGARLGDFNMFHVFFGGIAVFATPVAAVAIWSIWLRLRATGHGRLAVGVLVLCGIQLQIGVGRGIVRLQDFGPHDYAPVPMDLLEAIKGLPANAKLAYACRPFEETSFWNARLVGLDAHTGRHSVPMCFQAEFLPKLIGTQISADIPSPMFQWAPQRTLYPDSGARPSSASVTSFLKVNGINYIYADALHPNSLVTDVIPIATSGDVQILGIP